MRWLALLLALGAGRTQEDDARRPTAPVAGAPGAAGLEDVVARSFAPGGRARRRPRGPPAQRHGVGARAAAARARGRGLPRRRQLRLGPARRGRREGRRAARRLADRRFVVKELLAADHAALLRHGAALAARMAGDDAADADPLQFTAAETRLPARPPRPRPRPPAPAPTRPRCASASAPTRRASRPPRRPTGRARPAARADPAPLRARERRARSTPTAFVVMANALPDGPWPRAYASAFDLKGCNDDRALVLRGEAAPRGAGARGRARARSSSSRRRSGRRGARARRRAPAAARADGLLARRRRAPRRARATRAPTRPTARPRSRGRRRSPRALAAPPTRTAALRRSPSRRRRRSSAASSSSCGSA